MNRRHLAWIAAAVSILVLGTQLDAADADAPKSADPDLPQPLDPNVAQPLLESSPFTRAINLSESIALTGIAYVQGKPVATLTDKRTKENIMVSQEPNSRGWTLAEAIPGAELKSTSVKIMVGPELVTIRYGDSQVAPGAQLSTGARAPSEREYLGRDENGKPYVRGSVYLPPADRERYYNGGLSREAHDKFRQIIRDNREKMFAASAEERATFAKQTLDSVETEEKARQGRK